MDSNTDSTASHRQPVPVLLLLGNANRRLRPAGACHPTTTHHLTSLDEATALLAPLGLVRPLREEDLEDLEKLADEVRGIAEAIADGKRIPLPVKLNEFCQGACANPIVTSSPDGSLVSTLEWRASSAVAELAYRVADELARLDPKRLRRCARKACSLLFYDTSRRGAQRWHSESPCGLRERQERFRAGHRK